MYRVLNEFLRPYTLLLFIAALSAIWAWRRESRRAARLALLAVRGLLATSLPAVTDLVVATLERQTSPLVTLPADTETIVVLGGGVRPPTASQPRAPRALLTEDTLERCLAAADVYRSKRCLIVVSGGTADADDLAPPLAQIMSEFLSELGVASDDLVLEDRSTTTYENATETQTVLKRLGRRRVILVTDAMHMPRAAACFRRLGLKVVEAPSRFISGKRRYKLGDFLPSAGAARDAERAMHEWVGMAWYRLKDRI